MKELLLLSSEELAALLSPTLSIKEYLAITEILDSRGFDYDSQDEVP